MANYTRDLLGDERVVFKLYGQASNKLEDLTQDVPSGLKVSHIHVLFVTVFHAFDVYKCFNCMIPIY